MEKIRITSRTNSRIKRLLQLQKRSVRDKSGIFFIEGVKEVSRAAGAGYAFEEVFFCPELISEQEAVALTGGPRDKVFMEVDRAVFQKIAVRENSGGVVVTARMQSHGFDRLKKKDAPLYLVIEGVEKPGNIGAVYRTADAAGLDGVILCDPRADIYNPNAVRASLGCVFTVPTVITTSREAITRLKRQGVKIFSTHLEASVPYHTVDFTGAAAIVAGTEATGLTGAWVESSDANIIIPMKGKADSLNISVSAAIVVFEAVRQREVKQPG